MTLLKPLSPAELIARVADIEKALIEFPWWAANTPLGQAMRWLLATLEQRERELAALRNSAGDNLCWLTDQDDHAEMIQALPQVEVEESCRRYQAQMRAERGVFTGGRTIAQLEEQVDTLTSQVKTLTEARLKAEKEVGAAFISGLDSKSEDDESRILALQDQVKALTKQRNKWANLGGAPTGKTCRVDPKDIHEIHGHFRSNDVEGEDCICEVHFTRLLEDQVKTLREALEHERSALCIVRDRQDGHASKKDISQGIALIDAALAATGKP